MIIIDTVYVNGWEYAIKAMSNYLDDNYVSDSERRIVYSGNPFYYCMWCNKEEFFLGNNDLNNIRKILRIDSSLMGYVKATAVITAPIYWWDEFSEYNIGYFTKTNNSFEYKVISRDFSLSDFRLELLTELTENKVKEILSILNTYRRNYIKTKDKRWIYQIKSSLPSSY